MSKSFMIYASILVSILSASATILGLLAVGNSLTLSKPDPEANPYSSYVVCYGPDGSTLRSSAQRTWRFDSQGYYFVPSANVDTVLRPRQGDQCSVVIDPLWK